MSNLSGIVCNKEVTKKSSFKMFNFKAIALLTVFSVTTLNVGPVLAKSIFIPNFGFESGLQRWNVTKQVRSSTTSRVGDFSAKLNAEGAKISRKVTKLKPNTNYELSAFIRGNANFGVQIGTNEVVKSHERPGGWKKLTVVFNSASNDSAVIFASFKDDSAYIDNVKLKSIKGGEIDAATKQKVVVKHKLNPELPPSGNFSLLDWKLSVPTDEDENGKSDTVKEVDLAQGYSNPNFFYTNEDGAMVFKVPVAGYKTSKNTKFTRVELREMLRKGNKEHKTKGVGKNNWVFSSAPEEDKLAAGGVDGKLTGTVSINHVTTTGDPKQVGRVVFAQIHANKDEPIRFYYRKLPNNEKGSIYFAHEPLEQKDIYVDMLGSRSSKAENPEDGVALGEKFSYEINVVGNGMEVKLFREGKPTITKTVNMSESGYDQGGQYMYFKAGAYLQDSTGNADDYAEVAYYQLENSH